MNSFRELVWIYVVFGPHDEDESVESEQNGGMEILTAMRTTFHRRSQPQLQQNLQQRGILSIAEEFLIQAHTFLSWTLRAC